MKVLLDENLPHELRLQLAGHECFTVAYMGWKGVSNGKLLRQAAEAGFEVMLTSDAGIEYQHNASEFSLSIIILVSRTNTMQDLAKLVPAVLAAMVTLQPRTIIKVS
jgi:hypothetical protein